MRCERVQPNNFATWQQPRVQPNNCTMWQQPCHTAITYEGCNGVYHEFDNSVITCDHTQLRSFWSSEEIENSSFHFMVMSDPRQHLFLQVQFHRVLFSFQLYSWFGFRKVQSRHFLFFFFLPHEFTTNCISLKIIVTYKEPN